ncbi:cobalamin B12-binding domain-containing protein [Virgisporangium ochraceum]|uniref:cobalamin B12-binding domain-containing protein n=1 Tax=Virgisporangium ochraceum TaxID=65505 RepID=UPI001942E0B2|nr:cobalamin-dependent protein [Virgisporangium ochraceum]
MTLAGVGATLTTFLDALGAGDEDAAVAVAHAEVDAGGDPVQTMFDLVVPAQREVGRRWAVGDWTVAQEHAATAVSEAVVAALAARAEWPPPTRGHVVVACAEREWHSLPARMVTHALRAAGWRATYLGASTPPGQLARYLDETGADAVAISCSVVKALPAARRMIEAVRESGRPVLAGGPAFGADARRALALGATAWAADAQSAVAELERITPGTGPCEPLRHAGADEHLEIMLRFADFRRGALDRWRQGAAVPVSGELAEDLAEHALHALAASLLADDRTVLLDADRWLVDLFTARGHDPLLAPRLWRAVRETVGELLPQARADLAVVARG